jgi:hypothetical protein
MTKGVVLFAHNNEEVDYIKIATYAADRIKLFLNVPVTLITNSTDSSLANKFDNVIVVNTSSPYTKYFYNGSLAGKHLTWNNVSRADVYELTPYTETLVIDVDYIINSNILDYCWNQPSDFLIFQRSVDLAPWRDNSEFLKVSEHSIPFYWATVFFFRKTSLNELFFTLIKEIRKNWNYYTTLYQIRSTNFRNDLAFSIAIHMMNGFSSGVFASHIPGKLFFTTDRDLLIESNNGSMHFLLENANSTGGYISVKTNNTDIHVMNKYSLMELVNE